MIKYVVLITLLGNSSQYLLLKSYVDTLNYLPLKRNERKPPC